METKYSVGQILFAIDGRKFNITPYQVTEHHVKTSLDGTENSYFARSARSKETINLSELQGPLFTSLGEAGGYMTKVAGDRIQKLVEEAKQVSEKTFQIALPKEPESNVSEIETEDEDVVVNLPDGRQAKLSKGGAYEDFSG